MSWQAAERSRPGPRRGLPARVGGRHGCSACLFQGRWAIEKWPRREFEEWQPRTPHGHLIRSNVLWRCIRVAAKRRDQVILVDTIAAHANRPDQDPIPVDGKASCKDLNAVADLRQSRC